MIGSVLKDATLQLQSVTDTPHFDAEILLAHVLQVPRSYLHTWPEKTLLPNQYHHFQKILHRRLQHEPIAFICGGVTEFWSLPIEVTHDTLIPRPETELLVEIILNLFPKTEIRIADLGTGSGAIALALAHSRPEWQIVATDNSARALKVAAKNKEYLNLNNITLLQGDWCDALTGKKFDAIVSNPPYIAAEDTAFDRRILDFEPARAFLSGRAGLQDITVLIEDAASFLKPGGYLILEHGYQQKEAVTALLKSAHYKNITTHQDLAGQNRLTMARI